MDKIFYYERKEFYICGQTKGKRYPSASGNREHIGRVLQNVNYT